MLKSRGAPSRSRRAAPRSADACDRVGEQPALVEADVARRRADQPRHRVLLHVLAHVEAQELHAQRLGELLGELGLADAGGPGEQEDPIGLSGRARPARASLIALTTASIAASWPKIDLASFEARAPCAVVLGAHVFAGMRAIVATTVSISLTVDRLACAGSSSACAERPASSITSIALSGRCGR